MERCQIIMDMPITVSIPPMLGIEAPEEALEAVFAFFREVDETFSPFKPDSEVSRIGRGEEAIEDASPRMKEVLRICDETARQTHGYFSAWYGGKFDPSGVVKGWAIRGASRLLDELGFMSHCIDAGGDIEARGTNAEGRPWEIGIRNPSTPRYHHKGLAFERPRHRHVGHLLPRRPHLQPQDRPAGERWRREPDGRGIRRLRGGSTEHSRLRHGRGGHRLPRPRRGSMRT